MIEGLNEAVRTAFCAKRSYNLALRNMCLFPMQMALDAVLEHGRNLIKSIKGDPLYMPYVQPMEYGFNKDDMLQEIDLQNHSIELVEIRMTEILDNLKLSHPDNSLSGKLRMRKSTIHTIRLLTLSNNNLPIRNHNPNFSIINQYLSSSIPIQHLSNSSSDISNSYNTLINFSHMSNSGQNENEMKCSEFDSITPYIGYIPKTEENQSRKNEECKPVPVHLITEVLTPWGMSTVLKDYTTLSNEEREVALIVTHLASNRNREYQHIHSDILTRLAGGRAYKHIINTLKKGTEKGKIIEVSPYVVGEQSYGYRLTEKYHKRKKSLVTLSKPYNAWGDNVKPAKHSDLIDVLQWSQSYIIYPTIEEVIAKAIELSKDGVEMLSTFKDEKIKKQCVYAVAQGMTLDAYDESKYRILDYDIADFIRILKDGWRTPSISGCGRVYYDPAGMPKWIRRLVKMKINPDDAIGEDVVELDYQALHSNLIPVIFKNRIPQDEYDRYLHEVAGDSHTKLANHINATIHDPKYHLSRQDVKTIGLSFWNKKPWQQKKSPIYPYLRDNFKHLMRAVTSTKFANPSRSKTKKVMNKKTGRKELKVFNMAHAETSDILFQSESMLMEQNLVVLRGMGIPAIYAYDALWIARSNMDKVLAVMNRMAKIFEIPTMAN